MEDYRKICFDCNEMLPSAAFHKRASRKDGLATYCKRCVKKKSWYGGKTTKPSDASRAAQNRYYAKNRDAIIEYHKQRWRNNPAAWNARTAARRAGVKKRTPSYANLDAIKFFYECCPWGCHVDHVIPISGRNVSGFHIETNLQWLPAKENLKKNNSFSTGY